MRIQWLWPSILVCLLLFDIPASLAQTAPTKNPAALNIAQRCLGVIRAGTTGTIQDAIARGTWTEHYPGGEISGAIVIKAKFPDKVRIEFSHPSGPVVRTVSGGRGVLQFPSGRRKKLLATNTAFEATNLIPLFSALGRVLDRNVEVLLVGTDTVNGKTAEVISISAADPSATSTKDFVRQSTRRLIYIEQSSGLLLKIEQPIWPEDGSMQSKKQAVIFDDYRQTGGLLMPFRQITYFDGQPSTELNLDSVQFNVGLFDADFQLPEVR